MATKNKLSKPSPEYRLYIDYESSARGGDPKDDSHWPDYTDKHIDVKFIRFHREPPKTKFFYDSIIVPEELLSKDKLYLCVVRYSSGDTFGNSFGKWAIVGVTASYKEAELLLEEAIKPSLPRKKGLRPSYKPWEGCFERLEKTEIHTLEVV